MVKNNLLDFLTTIGKLKKVKRTGWVREGVPNAESVAEHVYRVSLMSMLLGKKINTDKAIKMALLHELGETVIGDVVTERGKNIDIQAREEKSRREREAIKKICDSIDRRDFFELWLEYEEGNSEEAKFVKQMDKLEMAVQAYEYESEHGKNLTEFFENTKKNLKNEELIKLFNELVKKRK